MPTTTLVPNAAAVPNLARLPVTGAATPLAALSDASDSSYLLGVIGTGSRIVTMEMEDSTVPYDPATLAGSPVSSVVVYVRHSRPNAASSLLIEVKAKLGTTNTYTTIGTASLTGVAATSNYGVTITSPSSTQDWTRAMINSLQVIVTDRAANTAGLFSTIYRVYAEVNTESVPSVTVTAPEGTIETVNPTISWTYTEGSGNTAQSAYAMKIYSAAQYGALGFDPDTTTATATISETNGSAASHTITTRLAYGTTYKAYVQVFSIASRTKIKSAWAAGTAFTPTRTALTTPTVTATWDLTNNRVAITMVGASISGSYVSQVFTVQRSIDNGTTWEDIASLTDKTPNGSYTVTGYEYEAARGITMKYRGYSTATDLVGFEVNSPYSTEVSVATASDGTWWLKSVYNPNLNLGGVPFFGAERVFIEEQVGVFRPLGREYPVVISGVMGGRDGELEMRTTDLALWSKFYALMIEQGTLLLQSPFGPSQKYIRIIERQYELAGRGDAPLYAARIRFVEVAVADPEL
jgi:hypothetical protein